MKTLFIFHGTGGYPEENWFPWLKEKMESQGYKVIIPQFPTPQGQSFEAWMKVLNQYKKFINKYTIFVGHSLGGLFLLRLLEKLDTQVHAAAFIATSIGIKPILYYQADLKFSKGFDFNWQKIVSNTRHVIVFHSDNDPFICLENGKVLANKLETKLHFIPNAGHFNAKAGYTTFESLLLELQKIL